MTAEPMTGALLRLRPNEFRLLRDLVNAYAGLHFDDDALVLFDRRLADRLGALQLSGYDEYYKFLRFNSRGQDELDEVLKPTSFVRNTNSERSRMKYCLAFTRTTSRVGV